MSIKMEVTKKELDNNRGDGGLEISIPGFKTSPENAPGTNQVFIEYYEGKIKIHVWGADPEDSDPATIEIEEE